MIALAERHCPSGVNTFFPENLGTFADYIDHCREMIAQARCGASARDRKRITTGNAPFELLPAASADKGQNAPYRRGILLIHGLSDSPYFMHHLGAFFQAQGFRVMAILLPGHGTRPGDLLDTRWSEWQKAVAYGVERMALEADQVFIGGYSAGGALAVLQALRDIRIRGLFLFAPALQISSRARFANWHRSYSWLYPRAKWLNIFPDSDIYKYESFPKNAAAQMYQVTEEVHKALVETSLELPVFAVASREDVTVDTGALLAFMRNLHNSANRMVYYHGGDTQFSESERHRNFEPVLCKLPEQKILSSAHTAIVMPAEDVYYGKNGEYRNCLHYLARDSARWQRCQLPGAGEDVWQGEITQHNLSVGTVCRLMYNPAYPALKTAMRKFMADLPE